MYLGKKPSKFYPAGSFFRVLKIECLSKCPNFKKPPLPWKIPGYAPDQEQFRQQQLFQQQQQQYYRTENDERDEEDVDETNHINHDEDSFLNGSRQLFENIQSNKKTTVLRCLSTKWENNHAFGTLVWGRILTRLSEKYMGWAEQQI